MLAPTYVAENAPRGIRGLLVGFYQLFETMGAMVAFFVSRKCVQRPQARAECHADQLW